MLDPGTADGGSRNPGLGTCAHHLQRVLVGAERVLVTDVVSHLVSADALRAGVAYMTSGCRLGTESHSSSREVKYQPPRS